MVDVSSAITDTSAAKFDSWAIVELMGHQRTAGRVSEQTIGGTSMLRVDVPEVKRVTRDYDYALQKPVAKEVTIPAYTRYFSGAAVYSITPCTEEIARKAAASYGCEPPVALALPERTLPAPDGDAAEPVAATTEDGPIFDDED